MNLIHPTQHKNTKFFTISDILKELRSQFDFTFRSISWRIGVSESFLSRVYNGRAKGGKQLLAGLTLLLELETLKRRPAEKPLSEQILDMKKQVDRLQSQMLASAAGTYPAHAPQGIILNEPVSSGPTYPGAPHTSSGHEKTPPPPDKRRRSKKRGAHDASPK